jgi:hypothetical protein
MNKDDLLNAMNCINCFIPIAVIKSLTTPVVEWQLLCINCIGEYGERNEKYFKLLKFVHDMNMRSTIGEVHSDFHRGWAERVNAVGYDAMMLLKEIGELK